MKKLLKFILVVFGIFIAISVVSGIYQGVTGTNLNSNNDSYKVGFTTGTSGAIGQGYNSSIGSNAKEICSFLLELALNGSPNDGINWQSINSDDYLEGCLDGARESYPQADWVE